MKHTILYIASILLCASCGQEEFAPEQTLGYLSLSEVSLEAGHVQLISTRASGTEDLKVALTPEGGTAKEYDYAETISCSPGTYTLEIYSKNHDTANDNAPKYYYKHTEQVVIEEGQTEPVGNISVPMINFGVTFTANINYFTNYTFTISYNDTERKIKTGETAYFDISDTATTLSYTLSAKNEDGEDVKTDGSYGEGSEESIKASTIYNVTYSLATKSLDLIE